jgi:hypothetical protein
MSGNRVNDLRRRAPGPWWREADVAWLLLLVVVGYFLRAGELPIRGEEPTRAQIAREMVEGRDWLVPRQQGDLFLSRPPPQNWPAPSAGGALRRSPGPCGIDPR